MSARYLLRILFLSAFGLSGIYALPAGANADVFPKPPLLDDAVQFWQQVFTVWRRDQVVLHDDEYLGVVYDVIDLPAPDSEGLTAGQKAYVQYRRDIVENNLRDLERRLQLALSLGSEHQRLLEMFAKASDKYAAIGARNRVRTQRGMRERFIQGVARSGRYDRRIRQVFRDFGLPEDLAYLPHVESSFINHAHSSAGAAGVWQFMRGTGLHYLTINRAVDERFDPVFAARGAARYLGNAYRQLGDWGLAITSYNHGVGGMLRARRDVGPAIEKIVRHYKGPRFGFASRNFYAEFLAVRSIMGDISKHIPGGIRLQPPMDSEYVRLSRRVTFRQLANVYGVFPHVLEYLNPALSTRAVRGKVALPAGTDLWIPRERLAQSGRFAPYAERQTRFNLEKPSVQAFRRTARPANSRIVAKGAAQSKRAAPQRK
ncbi:MAG: lytic transglycosylase domain-containing protein, partial [Pseudomonadota bacterium]